MSLISAEEIYEVDTITLQEKIEELCKHPDKEYFAHLITLAKLQLSERQKVEQFGRKLANNSLVFNQQEFQSSLFKTLERKDTHRSRKSVKKSEAFSKLTLNSQSSNCFIISRKPSINFRYVQPKNLNSKSTTKLKKQTRKLSKITLKNSKVKPIIKTEKIMIKKNIKYKIQYKENDIFELSDLKVEPKRLVDLVETLKEQDIKNCQEIEENIIEIQQAIVSDTSYKMIQTIEVISSERMSQNNPADINSAHEIQNHKQEKLNKEQQHIKEHIEVTEQGKQQEMKVVQAPASFSQKLKEQSQEISTGKLIKQISLVEIENQKFHQSVEPPKIKQEAKKSPERVKQEKIQLKQPPIVKFEKIPQSLPPLIPPYHQTINSFEKLFPHSKNILATLKNLQASLESHFLKNIHLRCQQDDFLQSNREDIKIKACWEKHNIDLYKQFFGIDLSSFKQKSNILIERANKSVQIVPKNMKMFRVVRTKEDVYDIINSTFYRTKNWSQMPHGTQLKSSWNLLWTWSKPQIDFSDLFYFQKVNHFLGNKEIARKDLLKKNIQKVQKLGKLAKKQFDIIPETFFLPTESIHFIKKFKEIEDQKGENNWIMKPVGLSRGRGIQLITKIEQIRFSQPIVLQKYLNKPLLLDGYKFDLRVYVLVKSINPLIAYIYKEGFARVSTKKYTLNLDQMGDKLVHLTNFSVHKDNLDEKAQSEMQNSFGGPKITFLMLKQKLRESGISWENIWDQVQDIVLKSLISCMNVIEPNPNCFQLFGYDIIIDNNKKCWLLEVNSSPSLQKDFVIDEILKQQLTDDTIQVVNPLAYDRKALLEVICRRRKQLEGLKSHINTLSNSKQTLNKDLFKILNGKPILTTLNENRNYKIIAPGQKYEKILFFLQQYRRTPIQKKN